ncbi:MAG: Rab family GTPase [Candidatus Thorarchaeota archaeon]
MEPEPAPYMFKLIALGDGAVGKTSCVRRYTEGSFKEEYKATIGTTFAVKRLRFTLDDGAEVSAQIVIWDLGGQPSFKELRFRYMAGASMAFIVYDVSRPSTFLNIYNWYHTFISVCPSAEVAIVANKIDVSPRQVPPEGGSMVQKWLNVVHLETSARTGENVQELFEGLAKRTIERDRIREDKYRP